MDSFIDIWSDMMMGKIIIIDFKSFSGIVGIIRNKVVLFYMIYIGMFYF